MTPLFTIVIPVFNRAKLIDAAVSSVLSQTCQDFEIIVVDDGSTDDIVAAIEALGDPRIHLERQRNQGASAARNRGMDLANGRYIAFLDSDDRFLPHHLASMAEALKDQPATVAYSPVRAMRAGGYIIKPSRPIAPGEVMALYLMCRRGFVQTSGLVIPTEARRQVRYRPDATFGDDTDFAVRLQLAGYRFVMTRAPSVEWFDGPDPGRLSNVLLGSGRLAWLEDLRPNIPRRAYIGYRGWHVAKSIYARHRVGALALYLRALTGGSYAPRMALVVLMQIVLPPRFYRAIVDVTIAAVLGRRRRRGDTMPTEPLSGAQSM